MNARFVPGSWRWLKRAVLMLIALALLLGLTGITYQAVCTARDARRFPPPGRLVNVGGHRLHAYCTGEGSPTVILEAGWSDCWLNWYLVQPEVAKFTRVCSYDRAGMGWSDAGPYPRTSGQIVREMHALLSNAGIPGPYVLVGHSFGGFNVRLFAQEHPRDVTGLVLLDSIHEDQWARMPESMRRLQAGFAQQLKNGIPWCPFGVIRGFYIYPNPKLADAMQGMNRAVKSRTPYLKTIWSEWASFEQSGAQVRAAPPLPQVPLAVLTAGDQGEHPPPGVSEADFARQNALWRELQTDLARLCSNSVHLTVTNSGHVIALDQPAAVVEAIRQVVTTARQGRGP